ncbi:MAG: phosphoglycerate dehydrogenase [Rhodocyclaceae bacterium]|nr:phosphoglycerate dehydrogenase [Rhodocyclaceae bacterium]MBX3670249.1 phosphoglycerate dehydrogenase [Rhodocyclaceae bacterium]
MGAPFQILVMNQIAQVGLNRLPAERYTVSKGASAPDAIMLRSADLHAVAIPASVKAIGRAGAGTNNIPVAQMSARGVPVFNAPGANANAVKELVLAAMLLAARNLPAALQFVDGLNPAVADWDPVVEDGKKAYAGIELAGHTLGVIGLGKIGCLVADAAIKLGMSVLGHDPEITVDAAWSLPSQVRKASSVAEVLRNSNFVSLHVPLLPATRNLINAKALDTAKQGMVLLNFSREGVVDDAAVLAALEARRLRAYVCDFPGAHLHRQPGVITLPHLGASTREAEDNCAIMVADQLREFLEHGNISNSVNFPSAQMDRESAFRIAIANANVPAMVSQISSVMGTAGINIHNMLNKSRGEMAYTLVDVDSPVRDDAIRAIAGIKGVLAVRYLPLHD